MPQATTQAKAPRLRSLGPKDGRPEKATRCQAFDVTLEIQRLTDRFNALDELNPGKDFTAENYIDSETKDVESRINILREYLSLMRANSLAGALGQLRELLLLCDQETRVKSDEPDAVAAYLAMSRLCYSIEAAMRHVAGRQADSVRILERHLDSNEPYENRLELIGHRGAL